jgi:DNA-binding response OmpR family regulator
MIPKRCDSRSSDRGGVVSRQDDRGFATLIAVGSADLQKDLLAAFAGAEFAPPRLADSAADLRRQLAESSHDLIVMTDRLGDIQVAPMISEVRRGTLGPHPFPIVIVLVATPDAPTLRQVSNCGPDDIITLPCPPQELLDRINVFLSGARRPLVVNDGYAGPERRTADRPLTS